MIKTKYEVVKLSSVTTTIDYGYTASANEEVDGPLFLRITDLSDQGANWQGVPRCECDGKLKKKYLLKKDDIVFARTGATTGKSYLITETPEDAVFASYLIRVRCTDEVYAPYLAHFFKSTWYWHQIRGMAVGAAQPGINASKLKELEIPLPPLPEQKRIAAILDKADQLRQKRQQAIGLADEFLRSVFLDMFGDPVTNPKGWEKKELEGICEKVIDCPHSTPKWTNSGIIGLRTSNLTKGGWKWDDTRYVSEDTYKGRTKRAELQTNDIILSREGTVGIAALVPENVKMCMGQRLVQLRVEQNVVLPEYMLFLLLYELEPERISRVMAGSTSKHLNVKDLKKLLIMLPPIEKQRDFVSVFKKKVEIDNMFNQSNEQKGLTFNSLSQNAFSGEL